MALAERRATLRRLQEVRGSKVLVHFLSDRRVAQRIPISGMNTVLAGEAYPLIYEHIRSIGASEKLDLFLYTSGGHVDSVWPLVRLCRSVCKEFSVLVPMKALSAGTLLCLGADKVVMGGAALLSPIDPTTSNPFNPKEEGRTVPISVEDVTSYFDLARGDGEEGESRGGVGLKADEHILEVFKSLTRRVHPLALGNVKRVLTQIRMVARRLLEQHLDAQDSEERITSIVGMLTEELYSHTHLIDRAEAADILGDMVAAPSEEEEAAIWELYKHYEEFFELGSTFCIREWIGENQEAELETTGSVIESEGKAHVFKAMSKVRRISDIPQGMQVQIPPGQPMPIIPGLPTRINIEPVRERWYPNEEEV